MPNVGPLELVIVLVVALIVLGPKRLPEVGRSLGNGLREFKESLSTEGRHDDEDEDDAQLEIEEPPKPVTTSAATAPTSPEDDKS